MKKVVIPVFLILFLLNSGLRAEFIKIEPGEAIEDGQFGHQIKINKGELMVSGKRGEIFLGDGIFRYLYNTSCSCWEDEGAYFPTLVGEGSEPLTKPTFDFNDDILAVSGTFDDSQNPGNVHHRLFNLRRNGSLIFKSEYVTLHPSGHNVPQYQKDLVLFDSMAVLGMWKPDKTTVNENQGYLYYIKLGEEDAVNPSFEFGLQDNDIKNNLFGGKVELDWNKIYTFGNTSEQNYDKSAIFVYEIKENSPLPPFLKYYLEYNLERLDSEDFGPYYFINSFTVKNEKLFVIAYNKIDGDYEVLYLKKGLQGWQLEQVVDKLQLNSFAGMNSRQIAFNGQYLVVGENNFPEPAPGRVKVYELVNGQFELFAVDKPKEGHIGDEFGKQIYPTSHGSFIISAPGTNFKGKNRSGMVYEYFPEKLLQDEPEVSYIQPDICAPGMGVYMEIIGPHDKKGNFGPDGFYLNNPGDNVTVQPTNPDSELTFGPIQVSWDGRMISTIAYVHPDAEPNSTRALGASPQYQVEYVVNVNGEVSNTDTVYIVRPNPDFNGVVLADNVFGEGNLGERSPRGALIFESLMLGNREYSVSLDDTDPGEPGNQGYLPFFLISKGPIEGGNSTSINVGGGSEGNLRNAGPGGGGGGGKVCDQSGTGNNGGSGFTGGGPGGQNNQPIDDNTFTLGGLGTGDPLDREAGGQSLNGVPGPFGLYAEAAGGGTGHPFGSPGEGTADAANGDPLGGYGGGGGRRQQQAGGGGGYQSEGEGTSVSGGKIHGNMMGVPVAGGSGGASGNPRLPSFCAGEGGGGGGAAVIYGMSIDGVNISARGAEGGEGESLIVSAPDGGSGSGGFVAAYAKYDISNLTADVIGGDRGRKGGDGYVRIDAKKADLNVNVEARLDSRPFNGIRTDSTQYILAKNLTVNVTALNFRDKMGKIEYYLKPENGAWGKIGELELISSVTSTNANIDLPDGSDVFYFAVAATIENPAKTDDHNHEPDRIFSQAAWNIFVFEGEPALVATDTVRNDSVNCENETRYLRTTISNHDTATSNLVLEFQNDVWQDDVHGFSIVQPAQQVELEPGEDIELIVSHTYTGGPKTNITDLLLLPHNDEDFQNPWPIRFMVPDILPSGITYLGSNAQLNFPNTKPGEQSPQVAAEFRNDGQTPLYLEANAVQGLLSGMFQLQSTNPPLPTDLQPGEILQVFLTFNPDDETTYNEVMNLRMIATDSTCSDENNIELIGKGATGLTEIDKPILDFGFIPYCETKRDSVYASNSIDAGLDITITDTAIVGDDAAYFDLYSTPTLEIVFSPGEGAYFKVEMKMPPGGTLGPKTATLILYTDDPDEPEVRVQLRGEFVGFNATANPNPVNIGNIDIGFDYNYNFDVTNNGRYDVTLSKIEVSDGSRLQAVNANGPDYIIPANGGTETIDGTINLNAEGIFNGWVRLIFDEPCRDTLEVPLSANGQKASVEYFVHIGDPGDRELVVDTVDFGIIEPCSPNDFSSRWLILSNSGTGSIRVEKEEIEDDGGGAYIENTSELTDGLQIPGGTEEDAMQILFEGGGKEPGIYYGTYLVEMFLNGEIRQRRIVLKGEVVRTTGSADPTSLQFSAIVGLADANDFTIANNGPGDIVITGYSAFDYPLVFQITPNATGIRITPGNSETFTINFTPLAVQNYTDKITVYFDAGSCKDSATIVVNGTGENSNSVEVWLPELLAEPYIDNFDIPVYAKIISGPGELNDFNIDTIRVAFNRTLFMPAGVSEGNIITNMVDGGNRVIEIEVPGANLSPGDSILTIINGATMLGNEVSTDLILEKVTHSQIEIVNSIEIFDGLLDLQICRDGGDRLLEAAPGEVNMLISPNPANDRATISINFVEAGSHSVEIVDLQGRSAAVLEFTRSANSSFVQEFDIDLSQFAGGIYFLRLRAPSQELVKPVYINK